VGAATSSLSSRIGMLRPLRNRDFAFLWIGMSVSMVGDGIYVLAVAWQVYELRNTPSALAAVGIAWTLPQVLLMLGTGTLSDRHDRRMLMIAGDVIRFLVMGAVGILSITGNLTLGVLVVLIAGYGVGQAVFLPAFSAIVPDIVPDHQLVEANSLSQFVRPAAMTLVGPLVGGILVGAVGAGWAFVVDAGTFAFSALMISLIRTRPVHKLDAATTSLWTDMKEGVRYVRQRTWLWAALVGATLSLLFTWGPWETLVPYIVKNDLHGGAPALGLVFGAGGVGSVTAAVVMGQRGKLPRKPVTVLYLAWALGMLMTAGFGVVRTVWQAMIVALVAESAITVLIVVWFTLLQRLVAPEILGRVSSLDWMISIAGAPLSFAIVGPLASTIGADRTLVIAGVLGAIVTLGFMFIPGARDPERDGSLSEPPAGPAGGAPDRRAPID
jgi:predicted outer membrane lipoprotein